MIHAPLQPVAFITPSTSIGSVLAEFSIIGEGKKPVLTNHARYLSITIIFTISIWGQHTSCICVIQIQHLGTCGQVIQYKVEEGIQCVILQFH